MTTITRDELAKAQGRFWNKVNKTDGCWLWTGSKSSGYGTFGMNGKTMRAHRVAWQWLVKKPIQGELDHLCKIKSCVNPAHLEDVSHAENTRRADNLGTGQLKKTHCPSGHEYNETNTYIYKNGCRYCRVCDKYRQRIRRMRARQLKLNKDGGGE